MEILCGGGEVPFVTELEVDISGLLAALFSTNTETCVSVEADFFGTGDSMGINFFGASGEGGGDVDVEVCFAVDSLTGSE